MRTAKTMEANAAQTDVQQRIPIPDAGPRARVVAAMARVEQGQRDAMEELQASLCAYVSALREAGVSREATLADIRALMAEPATPEGSISLTPIVRQALAELTLQWCESEYNRLGSHAD
jgi:hypothetical protein